MIMGAVGTGMGPTSGPSGGPEDYEVFTEGIMAQLRTMPQVPLMEPVVKRSFNECPPFGGGPMNGTSLLTGVFGAAKPDGRSDYYTSILLGGDRNRRHSQLLEHLTGAQSGSNVPTSGILSGDGSGRGSSAGNSTQPGVSGVVDFPRLGPPSRASSGTPDTIISSSSPEFGVNNPASSQPSPDCRIDGPGSPEAYFCPALQPLDEAKRAKEESDRQSPPLALVTPVPLRAMELKAEVDASVEASIKKEYQAEANVEAKKKENPTKPVVKEEVKTSTPLNTLAKVESNTPLASPTTPTTPPSAPGSKMPFSEVKDKNDNVEVTLTLSADATQNVQAVIRAVANLLQISAPPDYDFQKCDAYGRLIGDKTHHVLVEPLSPDARDSDDKDEPIRDGESKKSNTRFCRECQVVVLSQGIQKKVSEMKYITKIDPELTDDDEVTFCSSKCYVQFTIGKSTLAKTEPNESSTTTTSLGSQSPLKPLSVQTGMMKASPSSSPHASPTPPSQLSPQVKVEPSSIPPRVPPIRIPLGRLGDSSSGLTSPSSSDGGGGSAPMTPSALTPNRSGLSTPTLPGLKSPTFSSQQQLIHQRGLFKKWKGKRWRKWDHGMVNRMKETRKHTDEEVARVMDTLAIAIRNKPVTSTASGKPALDAKKEYVDQPSSDLTAVGYPESAFSVEDRRTCVLCFTRGDAVTDGEGRLLNMDTDKWVHLNCALWSAEVYETLNGALMNVDVAVNRGKNQDCSLCNKKGATLSCYRPRCPSTLHLPCARGAGAAFYQDKTLACHNHARRTDADNEGAGASSSATALMAGLTPVGAAGEKEGQLKDLSVFRRVYINRDESKQIASIINRQSQDDLLPDESATTTPADEDSSASASTSSSTEAASSKALAIKVEAGGANRKPDKSSLCKPTLIFSGSKFNLRIGSMIFQNVGQLLPHQLEAFHTESHVFPVGFQTTRYYWSMHSLHKRSKLICTVAEKDGVPEFVVTVEEPGQQNLVFRDTTTKGALIPVLNAIAKMRTESGIVHLFPDFIQGENLFGLSDLAVVRIIESLPGIEHINNYNFRFGRSPHMELPLAINPTGCARSEPKLRTHFQSVRPRTLMTRSMGSRLPSSVSGITGVVDHSPYMKQFIHSKSQQYRKLRSEWRNNVYLGRSRIQGLGLFAGRDLEKMTMVIEYIGDVIRNEVANRREKIYEAQNRGIYMFRVNEDLVVDATVTGGPARYVNHSCSPNCSAEVVEVEKGGKIIIVTSRRICRGEELTYDYKFDFEDDETKIACLCGSSQCRKWMN